MPLPDFLIDRYNEWKSGYFLNNKSKFIKLAKEGQKPLAMIISCCDSRVMDHSIFGSNLGDYFIHKNIGNIVPEINSNLSDCATMSAVEYAIKSLKIEYIFVMGHTNCGAVSRGYSIFANENNEIRYQFIDQWLLNLKKTFFKIDNNISKENKIKLLEKENVVNSINNLKSYPMVKSLLDKNKLKLYGLYYEIEEGNIKYFDEKSNNFKKIDHL